MESSSDDNLSRGSGMPSCADEDLFDPVMDRIIHEGELMKFKPGISMNFISRYVQISERAFRYFKNKNAVFTGKPIVAFRKRIIE